MQKQWMIYGASTVSGKKILSQALQLGYQPILAGQHGQELLELSFQTGLRCCLFNANDPRKIQSFLESVEFVVLCDNLSRRDHLRLLKACLVTKTHYLDMSSDLFSFERLLQFASRFEAAGLSAIPGLHPSVILSDFVAASLKSNLRDANSLALACSESFNSLLSMVNSLQRGGRLLEGGKLRKSKSTAETLLVRFNGEDTLTVASEQADILAAWQSTRVPNIIFYRKADEKEVRLRKDFQNISWLLHVPILKRWLRSQDNFLIRHFGVKPFYPAKYAVWGKATNASGKSLTLRLEITHSEFDLALDVAFKLIASMLTGDLRPGVITASQALGSDYWLQSEHLTLTPL